VAVVTGANSGIGYETAKDLVKRGFFVVLACRNTGRGSAALDRLVAEHGGDCAEFIIVDLADLQSVRGFSEAFNDRFDRLDVLVNNAGILTRKRQTTVDGFELHFGVNHLGHFALTGLLLDKLKGTQDSRVVTVSSSMHKLGKVRFEDINLENHYSMHKAYAMSKLANLLFAFELQRRLSGSGNDTISVAAHPGYAATNLQPGKISRTINLFFGQSAKQGAQPVVYAATGEDVKGGDYYGPKYFLESRGPAKKVKAADRSYDEESAKRLWDLSTEMTKVEYSF